MSIVSLGSDWIFAVEIRRLRARTRPRGQTQESEERRCSASSRECPKGRGEHRSWEYTLLFGEKQTAVEPTRVGGSDRA